MEEEYAVEPFIKWVGGKRKLLKKIKEYYPFNETICKYAEPFVGGGAVLFDVLNRFDLKEIYIGDSNPELINAYYVIRDNVEELIKMMRTYLSEFLSLDEDRRKTYYYEKRQRFNDLIRSDDCKFKVEKAALMLFLNKTCFNGLYRVNKSGLFNSPIGSCGGVLVGMRKMRVLFR